MLIRPATTGDARAIARIQVRGWQIGYRGIVPDAYLARLTVEEATNRWLGNLAELRRYETLVAEDEDGGVIGWAGFGAAQTGTEPEAGEVAGLYVEPDCWGLGAGGALLAEAERGLASQGFETAILWTLTENHRTRRFYEDRGWHCDEVTETHASGAPVVRYSKPVGHPSGRS